MRGEMNFEQIRKSYNKLSMITGWFDTFLDEPGIQLCLLLVK